MNKIIILLLISVLSITIFTTCDKDPDKSRDKGAYIKANDDLSFKNQMERYRKSYDYYLREMTTGEIINTWWKLYEHSTYKIDGDGKEKRFDCYGAYFEFFKVVGANLVNENIELITKRVRRLHELNQITVYKDNGKSVNGGFRNIKRGSIVIFYNKNLTVPWHIGIIYGQSKGTKNVIQYAEMSGYTATANFANIEFENDNVLLVFFPSFQFWIGSLFQQAFNDK